MVLQNNYNSNIKGCTNHNKCNDDKVWNIMRITKMWETKWANAIGKMALIDLLDAKESLLKENKSATPVNIQMKTKWNSLNTNV